MKYPNQRDKIWLNHDHLLRDVLAVLRARRLMMIGLALLTFALTAGGTMLMPRVYSASASLLLKKERFDAPVSPEQTLVTGQPDRHLTEEELNSEVEILRSPSLLDEVVRRLHLDLEFETASSSSVFSSLKQTMFGASLSPQARAHLKLQEDLSVDPVKKSNIIRVSCKANDPDLAALIVNTLCKVYQEHHVRLRQNPGTKNFFDEQAQAMREQLREREAELQRVSPLPGSQLLNQQTETQIRQLNEFEVAWQSARTALAESEARLQSLEQQLKKEPEQLFSEQRESYRVAPDTIKAQLFTLELRRTELLSKYQPDHRLVQNVERELRQAQQMVDKIEKSAAESVTVSTLNPLRQRLMDSLALERGNLASLREKERELARIVRDAQQKLRSLGDRGYQQRRLDRDRELTDNAYQLYARKGEESRVSTALDFRGVMNVQIVEAARAAFKALSPNVLLNLILGLLGGLLVAVAAAFTLEYFNPTPRRLQRVVPTSRIVRVVQPVRTPTASGTYSKMD